MGRSVQIGPYVVDEEWRVEPCGRICRGHYAGGPVLLKELDPPATLTPEVRERLLAAFEDEAQRALGVNHPGVLRPFDGGRTPGGAVFVAFQRPPFGWKALPAQPGALRPGEWLRIGVELCGALGALSAAGIALDRLDPEFVFLEPAGTVRYLHLGLSHLPASLGLPGALSRDASPCAAPEGPVAHDPARALVYSVGLWLYAMLSNTAPPTVTARVTGGGKPDPLWNVSAGVDAAIQRALSREPADRFPNPQAFVETLVSQCGVRSAECGVSERTIPAVASSPTDAMPGPPDEEIHWPSLVGQCVTWVALLGAIGYLIGWGAGRSFPRRIPVIGTPARSVPALSGPQAAPGR